MQSARTVFYRCGFLVLVWLLITIALSAQDAPPNHLRLMVFSALSVDDIASANLSPDTTANLISQTLLNIVQQKDLEIIKAPTWPELRGEGSSAGSELATILDRSRENTAQAALFVSFFKEGRRITLIGKIYDVWQSRLLAGVTKSGLDDLGLLNLTSELVEELLQKLAEESPQLISDWGKSDATGMSRSLVFRSPDEFARISLEGGDELGIIHDGVLNLPYRPLAVKQDIRISIEKPGFYTRQYQFQAEGLRPEIKLPALYHHSKWTILAGIDPLWLFGGSKGSPLLDLGLGLDLRYLPFDEAWYLQLSYLLKEPHHKAQISGVTPPTWFMHDISLSAAIALLPPDWVFRVFVGVGLGTYLTAVGSNGSVTYVDPYVELPVVDFQINLHPLVFDFEVGSLFVFNSGINLLPQGLVRSTSLLRMGVGLKW